MPEDEFENYLSRLAESLSLGDDERDAIASELRDHMEQRLEELMGQGLTREQAIEAALVEFGDTDALAGALNRLHKDAQRAKERRGIWKVAVSALAACVALTVAGVLIFNNRDTINKGSEHPGTVQTPGSSALASQSCHAQGVPLGMSCVACHTQETPREAYLPPNDSLHALGGIRTHFGMFPVGASCVDCHTTRKPTGAAGRGDPPQWVDRRPGSGGPMDVPAHALSLSPAP